MKKETRHKAIAIPVTFADGKPRFLTVRDARFKEWIFVTGGCRKNEIGNPLRCALRELEEETRGVINIRSGEYNTFSFMVRQRNAADGVEITSIYHVFILFVRYNQQEQSRLVRRFYDAKAKTDARKEAKLPIRKTYDENDLMCFDTLDEYKARARKWDIIVNNVVQNNEFYHMLNSLNRKGFNLR
ncbi:NUDIX hydrolase [bacterium]|nr:NUDIX hydrolase [bacterium]